MSVGFGLAALLLAPALVQAQQSWGNVKGTIVWGPAQLPTRNKVDVSKAGAADQAHCCEKGPLLDDTFIVDAKSRGVRDVMVWLVDANDAKKALPIHPDLKALGEKTVVLDQPRCQFVPHVLALREGQTLLVKNSAPIPHNSNVISPPVNPSLNPLLPPGGSVPVEGWKTSPSPTVIKCSIHGWMNAYLRVFNHPYYGVTPENGTFELKNAPAGQYRLVIWHPEAGWVTGGRTGKLVNIPAGGTLDLGKIELTPAP